MNRIIPSLLYSDLYKYTMQQVVWKNFPLATAKYVFKCRNVGKNLLSLKEAIQVQVTACDDLRLNIDELNYLNSFSYFDKSFIKYLSTYKLDSKQVHIGEKEGKLDITIEGLWLETILWEIYILAIVHEVYTATSYTRSDLNLHYEEGLRRLKTKIDLIKNCKDKPFIVEFGTRRAYNHNWLDTVIEMLWVNKVIQGTSNVYYGMKYNIPVYGTMAHEFVCAGQALVHPLDSEKYMLNVWKDTYPNGELATALSDSLGIDKFLKDFDYSLASYYKCIRQDSGNPEVVCNKIINHYKSLGIDPLTRIIMFSDNLNINKVIALQDYCKGKIQCSFGVGTNISCDVGIEPLQNVIKLVSLNGRPVAKLSDSSGKEMCQDSNYINYLKQALNK